MKNIRNAREGIIPFPKIDLKMKISLLFFLATLFQLRADSGYAQKTKLSLDLEAVSVLEVIEEIEGMSEFTFLYKRKELDLERKVSIKARKQHIHTILQILFKDSPIRYKILDKQIILTKKEVSTQIKVSANQENIQQGEQQQVEVSGTITGSNGEALAGVNIIVKGTSRGTMSDPDGKYNITVQNTDVLTFSFIGFKTVERSVEGREIIDVQMEDDVTALQEVEVNAGYYKVKERNRTGSISRVTAEEIRDQPVTSPLMALQGRVPGLEISPSNGTPGIAAKIRIRGENSLRTSGKIISPGLSEGGRPLYIIDGVPVNSESLSTIGGRAFDGGIDPLATINPENIESIEVLKDADATAIYGSRGANGVILITTKQGSSIEGNVTNIQLSMYKGIGKYSARADLLNTEQYLEMRYEALKNDGINIDDFPENFKPVLYPDLTFWEQNRYTNWQKVLLGGTADVTDIQGTLSGGNQYTSYRFGGSFHKEGLITPGDSYYTRTTGNLNVNHRSRNNRFKASISVNYGIGKHNIAGSNLVFTALELPPNAPELYNEEGELNWAIEPFFNRATWENPLAELEITTNSENHNLVANTNLSYELINGLSAIVNLGYTELNNTEVRKVPLTSMSPNRRYNPETNSGIRPSARFNDNYRQSIIVEPQMEYKKKWKKHDLNVLIGATYQEQKDDILSNEGVDYEADAFLGSLQGAGSINLRREVEEEYRYAALFGRIGYSYGGRYLLNFTGRRDGSSRFGPGKRFGNFGAVGAAWIFSDETWFRESIPWINFGKLRGSYGTTGNDQIGNYQYQDLFRLGRGFQSKMSLLPDGLQNPDFRWEKTKKIDVALEMGFINNRLSFQANWYRNQTSNQLIARALPYTTGFISITDNFSEALIQNLGWEFLVSGEPIQTPNFQWQISFNLSVNRNKLVSFENIEDSPYNTLFKVGQPLSIQYLYVWQGVDPETGEHQFLDLNEDGNITPDDRQFNNAFDRDFYGGINQNFRYKGIELSMLFQFSRQNARYINGRMPGLGFNQPDYAIQRWRAPGDITDVQRYSTNNTLNSSFGRLQQSDANIEDASFIRLKTLNLSYSFPDHVVSRFHAKQLRLFIQGQNLFTLSSYSGPDPETQYGVPPIRMITSGIQFTF